MRNISRIDSELATEYFQDWIEGQAILWLTKMVHILKAASHYITR